VVSWRRDDGEAGQSGGAAAMSPDEDSWERAPIARARTSGPPAVSAAATEGEAAAWSLEGPGGGVRAVQRS
jgi:hypothetical protein